MESYGEKEVGHQQLITTKEQHTSCVFILKHNHIEMIEWPDLEGAKNYNAIIRSISKDTIFTPLNI